MIHPMWTQWPSSLPWPCCSMTPSRTSGWSPLTRRRFLFGNHNIDCSGASRESRYRHTKSGKYDGIHLYGSSGSKAYTTSVLNILLAAEVTSSEYNYHTSCPQFKYQNRRSRPSIRQQPSLPRHRVSTRVGGYQGRRTTYSKNEPFILPTFNSFSKINEHVQGNW